MPNIFALSDHHFGHANTFLKFKQADKSQRCGHLRCDYGQDYCKGSHPEIPLRPFTSVEEMDEHMIDTHNATVRPQDHYYFGGDVVVFWKGNYEANAKRLILLSRLNGHGRLILGNHCHWNMALYEPYFEKIFSSRLLDGILFTHIPVHESSLSRFKANVHGHLHANILPDPRYLNMCVEPNNYTPLALEDIKKRLKEFL